LQNAIFQVAFSIYTIHNGIFYAIREKKSRTTNQASHNSHCATTRCGKSSIGEIMEGVKYIDQDKYNGNKSKSETVHGKY
jgi:hypothetical protein